MMTYIEALNYLLTQLPMYQRDGAAAYKANLDNTKALANLTGNPQDKIKTIHIAGTNGKGSTSHTIAAILMDAGFKVGLYTSPHLKDFRERIRINNQKLNKDFVYQFVSKYKKDFDKIKPSFFEMTAAMAFEYFEQRKVDVAVIETGLGGRLDSTNIITPILSVITNVSMDHMNLLGDTLEKIAIEKAGIIKYNVEVVIGQRQPVIDKIFIEMAKDRDARITFASDEYMVENVSNSPFLDTVNIRKNRMYRIKDLHPQLKGLYQIHNLPTIVCVAELLQQKGFWSTKANIIRGIENVVTETQLYGRWQILQENPKVICDVAHNEDGIREIVAQLAATPHKNLHIVIGVVNDKDLTAMLSLLPKDAIYYFTKARILRALDSKKLADEAANFGLKGNVYLTVATAYRTALDNADKDDLIFVGGSTFVVAEVI